MKKLSRWILLPERFWLQVDKTETCWIWMGTKIKGYGQFRNNGKLTYAHRWSYTTLVGNISENLQIDHLCRNPSCVNPAHLEPVTPRENVRRGIPYRKTPLGYHWSQKTHCPKGHPYDEVNTKRTNHGRQCRECHRLNKAKYRKFKKLNSIMN